MKNNILKILLIISLVGILFALTGCGDNNQKVTNTGTTATVKVPNSLNSDRIMSDGTYQIRFSDLVSLKSLEEYKDKTVTAIGYLSPIMSYDGSFGYLMNLPYQTCPYCQPSDTKITNTMAIFAKNGEKLEFTEAAVIVKGTLKLESYTDEYGYSYNYRIADATVQIADTTEVGEKVSLYNELADKKIFAGVMEPLYILNDNVYYDDYYEMYKQQGYEMQRQIIDTTTVDKAIEDLKGFDQTKVGVLVSATNELKTIITQTNELISGENYSKLADYKTKVDNIFYSINDWMAEYQL